VEAEPSPEEESEEDEEEELSIDELTAVHRVRFDAAIRRAESALAA
jgi:hypothetical protein